MVQRQDNSSARVEKRQFSLAQIFAVVTLLSLVLANMSPAFRHQWFKNAVVLDPQELNECTRWYLLLLAVVPVIGFLMLSDALKKPPVQSSYLLALSYVVVVFLAPLLFVLLPWDFRRDMANGLRCYLFTLVGVTIVVSLYFARRTKRTAGGEIEPRGTEIPLTRSDESEAIKCTLSVTGDDLLAAQRAHQRFAVGSSFTIAASFSTLIFVAIVISADDRQVFV